MRQVSPLARELAEAAGLTGSEAAVLDEIMTRGVASTKSLRLSTGYGYNTVKAALARLVATGLVIRVERGLYAANVYTIVEVLRAWTCSTGTGRS